MSAGAPAAGRSASQTMVLFAGIGAIGACVLALLGVMLDWVTLEIAFGEVGRKGIDTQDGKIALVIVLLGIVAAFFATVLRSRGWFLFVAIFGAAVLAIAIYDGRDVAQRVADVNSSSETAGFAHASVGTGLWLLGIGGGLMLLASFFGGFSSQMTE